MVYRLSRLKLSTGQISWREAGKDGCPVILFLHGSWHDSSQWQEIINAMSKDFHCFALDLLGFGNSETERIPETIASEVACVEEFLDTVIAQPVCLVGHSLGGWIAIAYALKYPDRVRAIVTIAPEGLVEPTSSEYGNFTKFMLGHPWLFKTWLGGLKLLTLVSDDANLLDRQQQSWEYFARFPTTCKLFFQRSRKSIGQELVGDKLSGFKTPILILQSEADDASTIAQSQAYAQAIQIARYRSLPATDPALPDRDEDTIAAIYQFIADLSAWK